MKALLSARYSSAVLFSRRSTIFLPRTVAFASMVEGPSAVASGGAGGGKPRARRPRGGRGRTANGSGGIAGGAPGPAPGLGGAPAHFSTMAVPAGKVRGRWREQREREFEARLERTEIRFLLPDRWAASGKKNDGHLSSLSLFSPSFFLSFDDKELEEAITLELHVCLGTIKQYNSLFPAREKVASRKKLMPSCGVGVAFDLLPSLSLFLSRSPWPSPKTNHTS